MSRYEDELEAFKRWLLLRALHEHQGNVTRAAAAIGLERSHFYRMLRARGILVEHLRAASAAAVGTPPGYDRYGAVPDEGGNPQTRTRRPAGAREKRDPQG
jgi:hypothetical protein